VRTRGGDSPPRALPMRELPSLPTDFLDEVETALRETARQLSGDHRRLATLEELAALCRQLRRDLGRPVSVFDLIRAAGGEGERQRRQTLVRELRRPL
jgi:hypothetical protein